jgi:NAD(P)-dependent dehydrogenase (short-subunit alcohol dehydrogenase family)
MEELKGLSALITGGSKGIGYGVAEAMVKLGMNVAITSRSKDEVTNAAATLSKLGPGRAIGLKCDVRDYSAQRNVVDQAVHEFGKLDAVVANAGVGRFASIDEMTLDNWNDTIDINLTGVFYTVKASLEALKESQGFLVTIASLAGSNFFARGAAYNASKFGLVGFTQAVMLDVRDAGVRVSTIMPGSVASHFAGHTPTESDSWKIQPEDVGRLVVDLLRMPARTLPSKVEVRPARPKKSK